MRRSEEREEVKVPESSGLDLRHMTPVFLQYERIKRRYSDCIVLFRLGDFYECFGEDAKVVSEALGLVLTSREARKGRRVPMCGIPHHALDRYLPKLLEHGFRVAICEQVEDPKQAKGLVRREVVRVVTKGTVVEEGMLDERTNNYLAALAKVGDSIGLSWADLSTGEFCCQQFDPPRAEEELLDELTRLMPVELLWPKEWENPLLKRKVAQSCGVLGDLDLAPGELLDPEGELCQHFGVQDLSSFGCEILPAAQNAAARVLHYLKRTQMGRVDHIRSLRTKFPGEHTALDQTTLRNLEILRSMRTEGRYGTFLWALDKTKTPMGSRLLQRWLCMPLLNVEKINERLDAVEELYTDPLMRGEVREALRGMPDLERLVGRVGTGSANARHLAMIREALGRMPRLSAFLEGTKTKRLTEIRGKLGQGKEVFDLLQRAISDDPPAGTREPGIIREGFSQELDELRRRAAEAKEWISSLEGRERRRTGIKSLKVGYNQVIGYYIEVTKPNLHLVPPDYIRKQTLVNSERFITPELKEYESLVLGAKERVADLEGRLFQEVRERVAEASPQLLDSAQAIAELDVLSNLAELAVERDYTRPEVAEDDRIHIKEGRHPVVELTEEKRFVPNDVYLDTQDHRLLVITGPNMAGKSVYLRQVALVVIMAQAGSFVPAKWAHIGLVDRVFTRVGATDELALGRSTFMVEMSETANILHNATKRSLLLLDEIGRGTSTFDGLSIAWAVSEFIHERLGARTLFATHYHQLNALEELFQGVKNFRMAVREEGGRIVFLHKVEKGGTDKSYGVEVARLAGLPQEVIERAQELLRKFEEEDRSREKDLRLFKEAQLSLFSVVPVPSPSENKPDPVVEEIKSLDINKMTPLDALLKLAELREKALKRK